MNKPKKCDECGKPFPVSGKIPKKIRDMLDKVTTCSKCLVIKIEQANKRLQIIDRDN